MESNSDSDDDCEECFGIAPYRFEPTNNSSERAMSLKVDDSPVPVTPVPVVVACRAIL